MNKQDFVRNFSHSYFGLIMTEANLAAFQAAGIGADKYKLALGDVVPCYAPAIDAAGRYTVVRAVVKHLTTDLIQSLKVTIKWQEDMDEDPLFMRPGVPPLGMIQGRYTATYMSRRAARDTPRGHCPRHCAAQAVNKTLLRSVGLENGDEYYMTYRVYNRVFFDWNDACTQVENGELLGACVSKWLAVGIDGNTRMTQIYYKANGPVGYVEGRVPYVYESHATYPLREYIRKITGYFPDVR